MSALDPDHLDTILGLQISVAWAGEKAYDPKRLGWWDTDLIDAGAGGDLFRRLLPRTAAWAGLEMAREAAIRVDERARSQLANPDGAMTLFHFGFELDEALRDRLEHHKRHGHVPPEVLSVAWAVRPGWNRDEFASFLEELGSGEVKVEDTPAGRKLKKLEGTPVEAARALAAALFPLADAYPLPFTEMPAGMKG